MKQAVTALCFMLYVLQNSSFVLLTHYSRGVLMETYSPKLTVLLAEMMKFTISICALLFHEKENFNYVVYTIKNSAPLSVPGIAYFIQNTLTFYALGGLSATAFSVLSQTKIMFAAVFQVIILRRGFSGRKWRLLCLLVLGAMLTQLKCGDATDNDSAETTQQEARHDVALICLFGSLCISGFAGAFTEKYLKNKTTTTAAPQVKKPSLFARNLQLSFYGIVMAILSLSVTDVQVVSETANLSMVGWTVVTLMSLGGFLVAFLLKYLDNVAKNMGGLVAVSFTGLISYLFMDFELTTTFMIGSAVVIVALMNYNEEVIPKPAARPKKPAEADIERQPLQMHTIRSE